MRVASVEKTLPGPGYPQEEILGRLLEVWAGQLPSEQRVAALHRNVQVGKRHLALPIDEYEALASFGDANRAWARAASALGAEALAGALTRAAVPRERVGALFFVSVTGLACPSVDASIVGRLALPPSVKRVPVFGLGCVAGAAGLARAADYVRAFPEEVAVLVAVELCSLTLQRGDRSVANLIASGLFGDGAAAAVVAGEAVPASGPRVRATRSVFYPDSEHVMGWEISERGFQIVLSPEVPEIVQRHLGPDVDAFLGEHGLSRGEIAAWICHPGGPRVLEAVESALALEGDALALARASLHEYGNLSSASVLFVLADTMNGAAPPPGSPALLLAMGPGFCSELVLLEF